MTTSTPTRKEEVKDPIGITGWPKEKGRDGERTPMQWTPGPQAGFSTNAHTWLPIPTNYVSINVQTESADPTSQLNWYKSLIHLRRTLPALRDGSMTMLNTSDNNVLSYARSSGPSSVIVVMNCTAQPRTVSFDLGGTRIKGSKVSTLLTNDASLKSATSLANISIGPYATWIAKIE